MTSDTRNRTFSSEQRERVRQLFADALEVEGTKREAYVHEEAADDDAVRDEVLSLIDVERSIAADTDGEDRRGLPLHLLDVDGVAPAGDTDANTGRRIDRYELRGVLGEGGFGVVYEAEQIEPVRRLVALKVIRPGLGVGEVVARFEAERQALALMDHPNVARVFDGGMTEDGRPYFVMELVRGEPITEHCDRRRMPIRERLELFLRVCAAVQHAHSKGVIHRDIKPSNVLVDSSTGEPKVIDFGVAKAMDVPFTESTLVTRSGQFVGTPDYMSPEQADAEAGDIDARADVYALGVTLYELATGLRPYDARGQARFRVEAFRTVLQEIDPPRPSTRLSGVVQSEPQRVQRLAADRAVEPKALAASLRGDLDWIIMTCLAKDRERRYDAVASLAADVRRHLADQPVLAGPPTVRYRLAKFVRRNRVAVAAGVLLTALLLVTTVVSTSFALIAERARARADVSQRAAEGAAYAANVELLANAVFAMEPQNSQTRYESIDWPGDPWERRYIEARRRPYLWLSTVEGGLYEADVRTDGVDGVTVVATSRDGRLYMLDAANGNVLRKRRLLPVPEGDRLWSKVVLGDGDEMLVFDNRGHVVIANLSRFEPIRHLRLDVAAYRAAFSSHFRSFFLLLRDGRIMRLERAGDGDPEEIARVPGAWELAIDAGGTHAIVLGGHATPPRSIDLASGGVETLNVPIHDRTAALAIPGRFVGALTDMEEDASGIGIVSVFDGEMTTVRAEVPESAAGGIAVSPCGSVVAYTSVDRRALYAVELGGYGRVRPLGVHTPSPLRALRFVDGTTLLTFGMDGDVAAYDVRRRLNTAVARSPGMFFRDAELAPDEQSFYTFCFYTSTIQRHDRANASVLERFNLAAWPRHHQMHDLAIAPCGTWGVAISSFGQVVRFDTASHEVTHEFRPATGHRWSHHRRTLAVSPDGIEVVAPSAEGFDVWTAKGEHLQRIVIPESSVDATAAAFSPDGGKLALGWVGESDKGVVEIIEQGSYRVVRRFEGLGHNPHALTFSPDGTRLAIAPWWRQASIYSVADDSKVALAGSDHDRLWQLVFTADGERVIAGVGGNEVLVWDAASGRLLMSIPMQESVFGGAMADVASNGDLIVCYGTFAEVHPVASRGATETAASSR